MSMSTETAAVAPAPTETPTTGAPSTPPTPVEPAAATTSTAPTYQSAKDRARAAYQRSFQAEPAATAAEPVEAPAPTEGAQSEAERNAAGRLIDPVTKQFLPSEGSPDAPAASEPPVDVTAETPAAPEPQTALRIDIPADHPLRGMGLDSLDATTPQQERALRALLNSYTRRQEVEQRDARIAELTEQTLRLQAQVQAREQWQTQVLDDGTMEIYRALKESNEDVAEAFLRGKRASLSEVETQQFETLRTERLQQEIGAAAVQFRSTVQQNAGEGLPAELASHPALREVLAQAMAAYGAELDARDAAGTLNYAQPYQWEEFVAHRNRALLSHPQTRTVLQQLREAQGAAERQRIAQDAEAKARQAAAEAEKQRLEAAAQRRQQAPPHPLGQIDSRVRTDRLSTTTEDDLGSLPAHQRKRAIKERLFGAR